jgi:hypothetical protein
MTQQDINDAEVVEVEVSRDGKTVWVNINGECVVRCNKPEKVVLRDGRPDGFALFVEALPG